MTIVFGRIQKFKNIILGDPKRHNHVLKDNIDL